MAGRILIADLADELQVYRATVFKAAKRLSIAPEQQREPSRGNQRVSTVSPAEADQIRADFRERNRTTSAEPGEAAAGANEGLFYLIQLEPELDPARIKVGFTTDLDARLRHHRCAAPFACYVKTWPCRRTWERAAIDCITEDLHQLHTEVFRADSIENALKRGDGFFALMPSLADPESDETSEEQGAA